MLKSDEAGAAIRDQADGDVPAEHEHCAYGCNQPCTVCETYYVCTLGSAHDGPHWCEMKHPF